MTKLELQLLHKVSEEIAKPFIRDLLAYLARNCPSTQRHVTDATQIVQNNGETKGFFTVLRMIEDAHKSAEPEREHAYTPYSEDRFPQPPKQ